MLIKYSETVVFVSKFRWFFLPSGVIGSMSSFGTGSGLVSTSHYLIQTDPHSRRRVTSLGHNEFIQQANDCKTLSLQAIMHFLEWKRLNSRKNHWGIFLLPLKNMSALVQIMAWRLFGAKPLAGTTMTLFTDAYTRQDSRFKHHLFYRNTYIHIYIITMDTWQNMF